jgi:hypothetical protein
MFSFTDPVTDGQGEADTANDDRKLIVDSYMK